MNVGHFFHSELRPLGPCHETHPTVRLYGEAVRMWASLMEASVLAFRANDIAKASRLHGLIQRARQRMLRRQYGIDAWARRN